MSDRRPVIKTLWFDLGNVLLFFDFKPAFVRLRRYTSMTPAQIRSYFKNNPRLEARIDEGAVSARELYRRLVRDLGLKGIAFNSFKKIWNEIFRENHPVIRLVQKLRRMGFRLVLVSNTNQLHIRHIFSRYGVLPLFDKLVLSYRVKARKPSKAIYAEALRHSKARPEEIFYTDDRRELVQEARRMLGIHSHVFKGPRSLKRELKKLGVLK